MRGVNKVILVGTVGGDPVVKSFANGGTVANVSLATNETWLDKATGERRESTEWHRLVFNNRQAEVVQQYIKKGSKIYVEGSLRTRKWTNKEGQEQYTTEVRVDNMQMLDSRQGAQQDGFSNQPSGYQNHSSNANAYPDFDSAGAQPYGTNPLSHSAPGGQPNHPNASNHYSQDSYNNGGSYGAKNSNASKRDDAYTGASQSSSPLESQEDNDLPF